MSLASRILRNRPSLRPQKMAELVFHAANKDVCGVFKGSVRQSFASGVDDGEEDLLQDSSDDDNIAMKTYDAAQAYLRSTLTQ